jgi:cytochrome c553
MIPNYPNLAGQKEQYLAESLKAYRDGTRKNMIMAPMAAGLSDDDIKNLAAYYASLDPTGKN